MKKETKEEKANTCLLNWLFAIGLIATVWITCNEAYGLYTYSSVPTREYPIWIPKNSKLITIRPESSKTYTFDVQAYQKAFGDRAISVYLDEYSALYFTEVNGVPMMTELDYYNLRIKDHDGITAGSARLLGPGKSPGQGLVQITHDRAWREILVSTFFVALICGLAACFVGTLLYWFIEIINRFCRKHFSDKKISSATA